MIFVYRVFRMNNYFILNRESLIFNSKIMMQHDLRDGVAAAAATNLQPRSARYPGRGTYEKRHTHGLYILCICNDSNDVRATQRGSDLAAIAAHHSRRLLACWLKCLRELTRLARLPILRICVRVCSSACFFFFCFTKLSLTILIFSFRRA